MDRKIVFLDRDGVINSLLVGDWVKRWEDFEFLPRVKEGFQLLSEKNCRVFIITNQRVIGLGNMTREQLDFIHQKMLVSLEGFDHSIHVEDIFVCPHLNEDLCFCRKPKPGLLLQAQKKYNLDLSKAIMLGDKFTDRQAANAAGVGHFFLVDEQNSMFDIIKKNL